MMAVSFYWVLFFSLIFMIFYKEKPEIPTSIASEYPREEYMVQLKKLMCNKDYVFLFFGFSLCLSNFNMFIF